MKADKPEIEAMAESVAAPVEEVKEKKTHKRARKAEMAFVIQSPFGGEITPEEIRARIGEADAVYVRVDQNKAYAKPSVPVTRGVLYCNFLQIISPRGACGASPGGISYSHESTI